jgi:hypothetical protein
MVDPVMVVKNAIRNGFSLPEIIDKVQSKVTYTNGNVPGIPYIKSLVKMENMWLKRKRKTSKRKTSKKRRTIKRKSKKH